MKFYILHFVILTLLISCSSPYILPYKHQNFKIGNKYIINVGEAAIEKSEGVYQGVQDNKGNVNQYFLNKFGSHEEFIYTGISGKTIFFTFREYITNNQGNYIKPAFSLSLNYDISTDSILTFRSYIIMIYNATSSSLSYSIIGASNSLDEINSLENRNKVKSERAVESFETKTIEDEIFREINKYALFKFAGLNEARYFVVSESNNYYLIKKNKNSNEDPRRFAKGNVISVIFE